MNIIVMSSDGRHVYCRPDTSLERENRDFYLPDNCLELEFTPVLFARVSKSGKCVSAKFAERYYDAVSAGVLFYEACEKDSYEIASSSCCDHSSRLPQAMMTKADIAGLETTFNLFCDEDCIYSNCLGESEIKMMAEDAIVKASAKVSLRIGDLIVVETSERIPLAFKNGSRIEGQLDVDTIIDFEIQM